MKQGTYGGAAGSGVAGARASRVEHKAHRKISRQGNSLMVAIPQLFMRNLNLYPGDMLELVYDAEWGGFFVRPLVERVFRPPSPPAPPAVGGSAT